MSDPTPRVAVCPTCSALLQPRDRFCPDCGRPIGEQPAADRDPIDGDFGVPDTWPGAEYGFAAQSLSSGSERRDRRDSRNGVLFVAAAMVLVFGILVGSLSWLLSRAASPDAPSTPASSAASGQNGSPSSAQPSASPSASDSSPGSLPPVTGAQQNCPQTAATSGAWTHSVSGNAGTTCEFAEAVRAAFLSAGATAGVTELTVTSPVTNQEYPMNCVAEPAVVTCRGAENASIEVLLYP